jgi:hypothetical protein
MFVTISKGPLFLLGGNPKSLNLGPSTQQHCVFKARLSVFARILMMLRKIIEAKASHVFLEEVMCHLFRTSGVTPPSLWKRSTTGPGKIRQHPAATA